MKRSKKVALVMMGAGSLALTSCGESQVDVGVFESLDQCIGTPGMTRELCEGSLAASQQQHIQVAPKYTSQADCEADFGAENCETAPYQTSTGGSVFMPLMMGFMMGQMMGGMSQPLYRSRDDARTFRTADNRTVGTATGLTKTARSATTPPSVKTTTTRRGGFGATARTMGTRQTARSFGG